MYRPGGSSIHRTDVLCEEQEERSRPIYYQATRNAQRRATCVEFGAQLVRVERESTAAGSWLLCDLVIVHITLECFLYMSSSLY